MHIELPCLLLLFLFLSVSLHSLYTPPSSTQSTHQINVCSQVALNKINIWIFDIFLSLFLLVFYIRIFIDFTVLLRVICNFYHVWQKPLSSSSRRPIRPHKQHAGGVLFIVYQARASLLLIVDWIQKTIDSKPCIWFFEVATDSHYPLK